MATSEPDLLSELARVCSETQFLKRGLFGDGVSDVLEIPQILPVVLCRSPPAGECEGIAVETERSPMLSLSPVALSSLWEPIEPF